MAKYALVKNGIVQNVIVAEPELIDTFEFNADSVVELKNDSDLNVSAGDKHDGEKFIKAPEPEQKPPQKSIEDRLAELTVEIEKLKAKE